MIVLLLVLGGIAVGGMTAGLGGAVIGACLALAVSYALNL